MIAGRNPVPRRIGRYVLYAIILFVFVAPLYWAVVTSVKSPQEMFTFPPQWFAENPTLQHYKEVILSTSIPIAYRNSFIISGVTVALTAMLATLAAYGFSRFRFKAKDGILLGLIVLRMLPAVMLIIPVYTMMHGFGLLDTYWSLIFIHTAMNIPFSVWIMKGFFDSIPRALDEAAHIAGCNHFQTFTRVILPLTTPGLIAAGIVTFFLAWKEFIMALTLTSSKSVRPISVALYSFMSMQGVEWGPMMTAAVLAIIVPAGIFVFTERYVVAGVTGGSLKE